MPRPWRKRALNNPGVSVGYRDPRKVALIEAVQAVGRSLDPLAEHESAQAVRWPGDKKIAARAREYVVRADACRDAADRIIHLIEKHWPNQDR